MDTINFLRMYRRDVKYVDEKKVRDIEIPDTWIKIFEEQNMNERVRMVIELWKQYMGDKLPATIDYLEKNAKTIELISYDRKYSMLYGISMEDGKIEYYEGGNSLDCCSHKLLVGMPEKLKIFYQNLHNGFFYYPSHALGIVPLDEVTYFGDDEWGIIEDLEEPLQIELESTYGFFKNGGGGYLAIDYNNCENDISTLWFDDDQPEYNINFWSMVDSWIVIGFEC